MSDEQERYPGVPRILSQEEKDRADMIDKAQSILDMVKSGKYRLVVAVLAGPELYRTVYAGSTDTAQQLGALEIAKFNILKASET